MKTMDAETTGTPETARKLTVELDKRDLMSLVIGTQPNYGVMGNPLIDKCGFFRASYGHWDWNPHVLETMTEEQLFEMYTICRNSWVKRDGGANGWNN
jgi:hypothetical protein